MAELKTDDMTEDEMRDYVRDRYAEAAGRKAIVAPAAAAPKSSSRTPMASRYSDPRSTTSPQRNPVARRRLTHRSAAGSRPKSRI